MLFTFLDFLFLENTIVSNPEDFKNITHLIIPGVGAFPEAIENIKNGSFHQPILDFAKEGNPILGICLGMQLLASFGEEVERTAGLGLIPGRVILMNPKDLTIPHIGWNGLSYLKAHPIFDGVKKGADLYFVHSYYFKTENDNNILCETTYGDKFPSVVVNDLGNVVGMQYHPEKSQKQGLKILENFSRMEKC